MSLHSHTLLLYNEIHKLQLHNELYSSKLHLHNKLHNNKLHLFNELRSNNLNFIMN